MKKIMAVIAVAATAFAAQADTSSDVLMWYLDMGDAKPETGVQGQTFDTLNFYLRAKDDGSTIGLNQFTYVNPDQIGTGQGAGTAAGIAAGGSTFAGVYHTDLSGVGNIDWTRYEFMMTLYAGGSVVAFSENHFHQLNEGVTYSTLTAEAAIYARPGGVSDLNPSAIPSSVVPYNFGPHIGPEPTGGLLMLVGGALLALRRRRQA